MTDRTRALAAVEAYRVRNALPGTLEALQEMQAEMRADTLSDDDRRSYRIAFAGFRELFFGKEGATA